MSPLFIIVRPWTEHHPLLDGLVDAFAIVLAIIAIVYAVIQRRDSKALNIKSSQLFDQLQAVGSSLSTRYVGLFPDNIKDIIEVVSTAERNVYIMLDIAAYGHYSKPHKYLEYFQTLETLGVEREVRIKIIAYDKETAKKGHASQFRGENGENGFSEEMKQQRFRDYFDKFHRSLLKPADYQEFDATIAKEEEKQQNRFKEFAEVILASEPLRFFLWLADDKEAVFCFENYGQQTREISFRTRDIALLRTFKDLFEQNWEDFKARQG